MSFQIRANPSAGRHKQKAIWQPLTTQAFSFFSSPVAMETALFVRLREEGGNAELPSEKKPQPTPDLCLQGHEGLGAAGSGRGAGQRPTGVGVLLRDSRNCSVSQLILWVATKR